MKKQAITVCILCILLQAILTSNAQQLQKFIGEQPWHLIKVLADAESMQTDGTVALYRMFKGPYGVLKMNSKGQEKWKTSLKGKPFSISRLGNRVLVLSGESDSYAVGVDNIEAVLLDPQNGKITLEKTLLTGSKSTVALPTFYTNASGKYFKVGLRYPNPVKGSKMAFLGFRKRLDDVASSIMKAEVLTFDNQLNISGTQPLEFPSNDLLDAGSVMDVDGNIIYSGYDRTNSTLNFYEFVQGKSQADKQLKATLAIKKLDLVKSVQMVASDKHPSTGYFVAYYKNSSKDLVYEVYRLAFKKQQALMSSDLLDKPYRKALEAQTAPSFEGIRKPDLDDLENLELISILEDENKVVMCRDTRHQESSMSNVAVFTSGNGLISIFDQDMKKLSEHVIAKKYKSYLPSGLGLNLYIKDHVAHFIANDSEAGYMKAEVLFGKIDIQKGKILSVEHIGKEDIHAAEPGDIENILWFNNQFILGYLRKQRMLTWDTNDILCIYNY